MKCPIPLKSTSIRLGDEGTAIVFLNEENKNMFPELIEILKSPGAIRDPLKLVAN